MPTDEEIESAFQTLAAAVAAAADGCGETEDTRRMTRWTSPASRHPAMLGEVKRSVEGILAAPAFEKHHERIREAWGNAVRVGLGGGP